MKFALMILVSLIEMSANAKTVRVCFDVCTEDLKECEVLKAIAIDGQVSGLKVPDGKIVINEIKCPRLVR